MTETVSSAVARVKAPAELIENSLGSFAKMLPAAIPAERFGRWAIVMMTRALNDPKQYEAWSRVLHPDNEAGRLSVMSALMDSASLGLEPGREYHLVPFGHVVSGMTDYKGEIKLITNAEPSSVIAMLVHELDRFHMIGANIPPSHDADWFADRGPIVGGYAYVDYGGRYSLVVRMSEADFLAHRAKSKTAGRPDSPWQEWPEAMRSKTLVHQVRKMVPWAAERQW